jgi:hypothetical protein
VAILLIAILGYGSTVLGFPPGQSRGAGSPYTYTFDGAPVSPESAYWMGGFDVQVHTRSVLQTPNGVTFMEAGHGSACDAPPATHPLTMAEMTVFRCKDHVMTAIRADDYGVIYLTPDRLLDWSDGEATLSIDASTLKSSTRDWWDIYLTDWNVNLALPFNTGDVDLQGNPRGDYLHIDGSPAEKTFTWEGDDVSGLPGWALPHWQASSATQRDTFVLTIRKSGTFDFCKPDESICFAKNQPHGLRATRAVVQIGHHSYTPRKDGAGVENTWHWDNLSLSDSVPFTMIRANERIKVGSGTFTFSQPAPENAYLRFSAIGKVRINGQMVNPQVPTGHPEHFNSYFVPIPAGTTSVTYQSENDDWYSCGTWGCGMKDVAIWSQSAGSGSVPTNTPMLPTNTPVVPPTNTPVVPPTNTPVAPPTNTPVIPATSTPVPPTVPGGGAGSESRIMWQGQEWYLHGANLPWYNWSCDFGCNSNGGVSSNAVKNAIEPTLEDASQAGMKNIRWWMFPGNPWQINTNGSGTPTGINNAVFADIDAALALAEEYDLYYTFVLFSAADAIPRSWMTNTSQRTALANVLGQQLFRRYANHPRILAWEIFNEPEFQIWSGSVTQVEVVDTVKAIAAQANAETASHVTVGSAMLDGLEMWVGAGLDFYQAHWYDYMQPGGWCARCTDYATVKAQYNLDRPLVIGEYYVGPDVDALQRLEDWYAKGYAGAWAWSLLPNRTADQLAVDVNAAATFASRHSDDGPNGVGGGIPPTATNTPVPPTSTRTNTPVATPTRTNTPVPTATRTTTPAPTATRTNTPVPTATRTSTPVPGNGTVSGSVELQANSNHAGITVTLSPGGRQTITAANGSFSFTNVPTGTYTLRAIAPGFLGSQRPISVSGNGNGNVNAQKTILRGGDTNDDGVITIVDVSAVVGDFGKPPVNGSTDLNRSGLVDIVDVNIAVANFGLVEWLPW